MDSHVFVFNKNFSVPFSSHDFFQSLLETMKAPNIYKFKGQGVLHVWLKKYHLLIHEPAAWLVDVVVLVLEETVNNNFLFTFSMSFMVLHISFHSSFSRLKSPGLFICSSYGKYFIPLITLVLKNFPSSITFFLKVGRQREGKHPKLSPIPRMPVYFTAGMVCSLFLSKYSLMFTLPF